MARVVVHVMPKAEILDPQGQAIVGALGGLGISEYQMCVRARGLSWRSTIRLMTPRLPRSQNHCWPTP